MSTFAAAAFAVANSHGGRARLQPDAQCLSHDPVEFGAVLHRDQHAMERSKVSYVSSDRTFREKTSAALKRRLFPNTNLMTKQLAYALRISEPTVWNLLSGNNDPSGRIFFKLVQFFGADFLHEVFGGPNIHVLDPRESRKAAHIQEIARLQQELEAMG